MISFVNCRFHARLLVSPRCCFPCQRWYRECVVLCLALSCCRPLSQCSLMVLMSSCPLGEQHVSVFCLRDVMVPNLLVFSCNQVFVVLCRRTGRQRHLVPFVGVSSVRCVIVPCDAGVSCGMRCGYGCSLWPQGVRTALLFSRLASNCSTERHSTAPQEANWLLWHRRVRATRASAKRLLRGRSLEASSLWHGSHV